MFGTGVTSIGNVLILLLYTHSYITVLPLDMELLYNDNIAF